MHHEHHEIYANILKLSKDTSIKPKIGPISSKISGNSPKLSQPRSPLPKLDPFGKISVKLQHPISRMLSGRKCKSGSRHPSSLPFSLFSFDFDWKNRGWKMLDRGGGLAWIIDSLDQTRSWDGMLETVCTPPLVRGMNENGG